MHAGAWLDRLARSDGEPRDRLLAALADLAPDAATVFTPLEDEAELLDAGILDAPCAELEDRWRASISPVFANLDLPMPLPARDPERGRLDHGTDFAWLWGEFTSVRRSDPGATW
jgi:1,2-phenylacetyl-CoA epoxidase catalytic subunit